MSVLTPPAPPSRAHQADPELRFCVAPLDQIVVRDATSTGNGSWTMEGYAAVFNQETVLYDSAYWTLREQITPGAFTDVLTDPATLVHFNFGHDMNTSIAATNVASPNPGSLELAEDEHGLRFFARVDPADPDVVRLAAKMRSGVVGQASFCFRIGKAETLETDDEATGKMDDLRTILIISALYDVCAAAQGAYPTTESGVSMATGRTLSGLQSMAAHLGLPDGRAGTPAGQPHRSPAGEGAAPTIAPAAAGGEAAPLHDARLAEIQQDLALAHPPLQPKGHANA